MTPPSPVAVVVLAAGAGTRMKSKLPKVLHPMCGMSLLMHALTAAQATHARDIITVVRHEREQVIEHVNTHAPEVRIADQDEIPGTGRAVQCALEHVSAREGTILVTYGDVPLLEAGTLRDLVAAHESSNAAVSILSAHLEDPTGYGRIVRNASSGDVEGIVEHRDADENELAITEINSGICAFDLAFLRDALTQVGTSNAQGEMYLTDVPGIARAAGKKVIAYPIDDAIQVEGVNDRVQLSELSGEMNRRILHEHMRNGVSILDPVSTMIERGVRIARDVTILPGVHLHGHTTVEEDASIGPDCSLTDVTVGQAASIVRTHAVGAVIEAGATIGPFTFLRPGTVVEVGGKVGGFVEVKNSHVGPGAKVPHLSYVGDAHIGEGSNLGAGTIVANYDGVTKHRTVIGKHVRIGSDSVLVAPVTVGDGAATGAGTIVREDVGPGDLAVNDVAQRSIPNWVARKRAGTAAAAAAQQARLWAPTENAEETHS